MFLAYCSIMIGYENGRFINEKYLGKRAGDGGAGGDRGGRGGGRADYFLRLRREYRDASDPARRGQRRFTARHR